MIDATIIRKVNEMYGKGYYIHEIAAALNISEHQVDQILGRL